jgi:hypothetical protein
MAAETALGREWRQRLDAARARRTAMTADPEVPGLWRPTDTPDAPRAPHTPRRRP